LSWRRIWPLAALIVGAVAVLFGALLLAKVHPIEAAGSLIRGSLGSPGAIGGTLRETTPLLLAGLAVFLGLRAGLFNIGVEGQFIVGALASITVALRVPGFAGMALGVVAGILAGILWALPAGLIRAYRNGHEVITTIMLNNVAVLMTDALVAGPLKDPKQGSATTPTLDVASQLPALYNQPPVIVSSGLLFGIVITVALSYWLRRTVAGYELQAVGANPTAARCAGVDPKRVMLFAMLASGAVGGLAGSVQALGYEHRFYQGFSPGYGFNALGVALLAGSSAYAVLPASLLFGILEQGGTSLAIFGVPKGITAVVLGLLILVAAAIRYRRVRVVA